MKQISKKLLERILYYLSAQDSNKDSLGIHYEIKGILEKEDKVTKSDELEKKYDGRINSLYDYTRILDSKMREMQAEFEIYKKEDTDEIDKLGTECDNIRNYVDFIYDELRDLRIKVKGK